MSEIKLIKQVSNMDRAQLARTPQEKNFYTQLAISEQLLNTDQPIEYTDEDVRDMLRKALAGTRARYGLIMQWENAASKKKQEEQESIEYIKTWMSELSGMEERAGQIGMIAAKLLKLDDNEQIVLVARHVPRTIRTRWLQDEITPIFDASLSAAVLVALQLVPRLGDGSKTLRDAIIARHFGVQQGTQEEVAARLGISDRTFRTHFADARKALNTLEIEAFNNIKRLLQGKELPKKGARA